MIQYILQLSNIQAFPGQCNGIKIRLVDGEHLDSRQISGLLHNDTVSSIQKAKSSACWEPVVITTLSPGKGDDLRIGSRFKMLRITEGEVA